jgi:hypothetical protein
MNDPPTGLVGLREKLVRTRLDDSQRAKIELNLTLKPWVLFKKLDESGIP